MELKEILAISGQPGLYKYVAQSTNGVIVESLLDGRRMNASASSKVSSLTEISMFTEGEDIALADVFTKIYAHTGGKEAISPKEAPEKLKAAFAEVLLWPASPFAGGGSGDLPGDHYDGRGGGELAPGRVDPDTGGADPADRYDVSGLYSRRGPSAEGSCRCIRIENEEGVFL